MKFHLLYLDHKRIGPETLQTMQYGGFDARVKRIKTAVKAKLHDGPVAVEASSRATVDANRDTGRRDIAIGDLLRDLDEKIWMYDHPGWTNVTKQMASVFPKPAD